MYYSEELSLLFLFSKKCIKYIAMSCKKTEHYILEVEKEVYGKKKSIQKIIKYIMVLKNRNIRII